ncbi:hypothetical protein [Dickeya oryzae]
MTRSRRGMGFRRVHAAHPAKSLTSAQFLTQEKRHPARTELASSL